MKLSRNFHVNNRKSTEIPISVQLSFQQKLTFISTQQ